MENASKALLMAGGILIAVLIISLLILAFNQIGAYQQSREISTKNSQIAKFNMDFERYLDDNGISGADIVTLANKISDYNDKSDTTHNVANSVDYSLKITLKVEGFESFNFKYAYTTNDLFKFDAYYVNGPANTNNFEDIVQNFNEIFNGNEKKIYTQLADAYDKNAKNPENINKLREILNEKKGSKYNNWNGTGEYKLETIKNFKEYTEFRTSTFIQNRMTEYYDNGQIKAMYFKFDS